MMAKRNAAKRFHFHVLLRPKAFISIYSQNQVRIASMKISIHLLLTFLCTLTSGAAHAADSPVCGLKRAAEMETKIIGDHLGVKLQINGRDIWMGINPASVFSTINSQIVDQLELPRKNVTATVINGVGHQIRKFTVVKELSFAGISEADVSLLIINPLSSTNGDGSSERG